MKVLLDNWSYSYCLNSAIDLLLLLELLLIGLLGQQLRQEQTVVVLLSEEVLELSCLLVWVLLLIMLTLTLTHLQPLSY